MQQEVRAESMCLYADIPEAYVPYNCKEDANWVCTTSKVLSLWWEPMQFKTLTYYHEEREVGFVPKGTLLPYPWWLMEEQWHLPHSWNRTDGYIDRGYRCLLIHIAIGYDTSSVLDTFDRTGTEHERRSWIVGKLKGLPPDKLRILPHWQNIDGQLFQWPYTYKEYLLAALPLHGIQAVLEGPLIIRGRDCSNDVSEATTLLVSKHNITWGPHKGNLVLLSDYCWVLRTTEGDVPVRLAPARPMVWGDMDRPNYPEEEEYDGTTLLKGEISIIIGDEYTGVPFQRRQVTITDTIVQEDGVEVVHDPDVMVTIEGVNVPVNRLLNKRGWDTYLYLEGVEDSISFDIVHRAAWSRRWDSGEVYKLGLIGTDGLCSNEFTL